MNAQGDDSESDLSEYQPCPPSWPSGSAPCPRSRSTSTWRAPWTPRPSGRCPAATACPCRWHPGGVARLLRVPRLPPLRQGVHDRHRVHAHAGRLLRHGGQLPPVTRQRRTSATPRPTSAPSITCARGYPPARSSTPWRRAPTRAGASTGAACASSPTSAGRCRRDLEEVLPFALAGLERNGLFVALGIGGIEVGNPPERLRRASSGGPGRPACTWWPMPGKPTAPPASGGRCGACGPSASATGCARWTTRL